MPRFIWVWLSGTLCVSVVTIPIGLWREDDEALRAIVAGIFVSLITMLLCILSVFIGASRSNPLQRMLMETILRLAIPLTFLLMLKLLREELLTVGFVIYFIPFQLLTIVATTIRSASIVNDTRYKS